MELFNSSEMTIRCFSELYLGFLFCQVSMKKGEATCMPGSDDVFDYGVETG